MIEGKTTNKLFRYFSQYGEDFLLWSFFDFKPQGYFVDVGSFDGIHLSNSYSFELIGWKGVCLEPHPLYFDFCVKNRPGSICINKACGRAKRDGVVLHVDNTGLFSSLNAIGADENITGHFGLLKDVNLKIDSMRVDVVTLDSVLAHSSVAAPLDFVSIDVEGAELDVLNGFDLERYKPRILVIETNNEALAKAITDHLSDYGYLFARKTKANSFFAANEADVEKLNSIDLSCIIERQIHPLGIEYTLPSYYSGLAIYRGESFGIMQMIRQKDELEDRLSAYEEKVRKLSGWLDGCKRSAEKKDAAIERVNKKLREATLEIAALRRDLASREAYILKLESK